MNELMNLPMDTCSALALIRATQRRALEEQDVWREHIASLQGKCTIKEALQRIVAMGAAEFMTRLDVTQYPVTPENRRDVNPDDLNWDDIPSDKQFSEVTDEEIRGALCYCNRILEHRDRIKGMAMFYELVGGNWGSADQRHTVGARRMGAIWSAFVGRKAVQEMAARAKARDDQSAYDRYMRLADVSRSMLECLLPTSTADVSEADRIVEPESAEFRREAEEVLEAVRMLCKQLRQSQGTAES